MPLIVQDKYEGEATILLYGPIGDGYGDGVTAKEFVEAIDGLKSKRVNVRINSPGGIVFDGFAMFEAMQRHPYAVNTFVDGVAASSAATVALGGKKVSMAPSSMLMIHDSWGLAIGNAQEVRKYADLLDKIDGQIAAGYAKRSKKTMDEIRALMDAETWYTADEAYAAGFVDVITGDEGRQAPADVANFGYRRVPKSLLTASVRRDDNGHSDAFAESVARRMRVIDMHAVLSAHNNTA